MTKHKGVRLPAALLEPVSACRSVLVCLPYQGLRALLALSERLEWKTTWIDETGKQQTLTDGQWALIDATIGGLNCPMCMDDLLLALTGIKEAIENQELTIDVAALVAAVGGVQTAIENQELTLDLDDLQQWLLGIQTAIENQALTLDLGDLQQWLLGIQTAIENQALTLNLGDLQQWLLGIQTAIENQDLGVEVDFSQLEAVLVEIKNAIENLSEEEMQIINNVCCGGCNNTNNCTCNTEDEVYPPDYIPPDQEIPPYEPNPVDEEELARKCDLAHYMVYKFRLTCIQEKGSMADYVTYANLLATGLGFPEIVPGVETLFQLWFEAAAIIGGYDSWNQALTSAIDGAYNQLVCSLYSAQNAQQAYDDMKEIVFERFVDAIPYSAAVHYTRLLNVIDFTALFTGEFTPPSSHQGRDCSCGDFIPITQPANPEYRLIVVTQNSWLAPTSVTNIGEWSSDGGKLTVVNNNSMSWNLAVPFNDAIVKAANDLDDWETVGVAWYVNYLNVDTAQMRTSLRDVTGTTDIQVHQGNWIGVYDDTDPQVGQDLTNMPEFTAQFTNTFSSHGASVSARVWVDGINGANQNYTGRAAVTAYILVRSVS
jgi:hypothetical protein